MSRRCPKCNLGGMTDSEFKRHDCRPVTITAHCQDCLALAKLLRAFALAIQCGDAPHLAAERLRIEADAFIKGRS